MATIGISPLDYYTINSFAFSDSWQIPHGSAMQIYFILTQTDTLGTRRYIPTAGSVVTVNFMRQKLVNCKQNGLSKQCKIYQANMVLI